MGECFTWMSAFVLWEGALFSSWCAAAHATVLLLLRWLGWLVGGWLGRRVGVSCGAWRVGVFVLVHRPALAHFGSTTSICI